MQGGPETCMAENLNPMPGSNTGSRSNIFMEDGVFLTWDDLWVTVAGGRPILQGLAGYAHPGELLAVMGPSGCGKSTLLDTLAGRQGPKTRQEGDILINGRKQALAYGTSAYVTQDDALITTLTVREAVYYSAQLQLPDTMTKSEKKERAEMTIREMGLQDAMDTRIGGWGAKGLSGGQKRRVSICIEILTRPKLLFLDEPTSGLDSAASYYVMSRIASLNQKDNIGRTIIASIHQPSAEVFQLFTNLYLLSAGKTVYFGSVSAAKEFFALNGFPCPSFQNPSDHFLKTINKDFGKDIELGFANGIPTEEVIDILVKSYKSSDIYQMVQKEIAQICKQGGGALQKSKRRSGFFTQCHVLTSRSFINMSRDLGYYWLRLGIYISLSIVLGSVFSHVGMDNGSIQSFRKSEPVQGRSQTHATLEVENLNPTPASKNGCRSNRFMEDGVLLTWDNLSVTVAGGRPILQGMTGYARPGEPLAIMGPSGCGKSTLLDTLAGRQGPNTSQAGHILINGHKQALAYGTSDIEQGFANGIPTLEVIDILARGSLMMFVASFLTFMAIAGFPSFVEEMKVFERERLNGHYGVTPFGIGNTLSALPFLALVALIPGAITYFLPGLHHRYQHFLFFVIILFACMMLVESLMMIVASVVPNILMGIIVGDGIQGIMILVGGFFRLPTDLPKPLLKYPFYHIVFHKYAYQGLFKNEFLGLTFPNAEAGNGGSPTITGEEILKQTWHFETAYSKWVDLAILFAMVVFYRVLFLIVMKTTEKVKPVMVKFMSATRRERTQVTVNQSATPLATPYCADKRQWQ
ncbi:hypothetical protein GOBAR_DD19444 [Gossypium barbadense]|nr:hypothetical protein GOBAR_DD19444 [Gossypium barbadense]